MVSPATVLSGVDAEDPYEFGTWRGRAAGIYGTWNNYADWATMESMPSVPTYYTGAGSPPFNVRWPGKMDFAQPMKSSADTLAQMASGTRDSHMTTIATNLKNYGFGDAYIRLGWEFNGNWFPNNYASDDTANWVLAWRRWYNAFKAVSSSFQLVWCANWNNSNGAWDVRDAYPGDAYVDAIGCDYYDYNQGVNQTGTNGQPEGINTWITYAAGHGKTFYVGEWGLDQNGDNPSYITLMANAFTSAKAQCPGLVEVYFDLNGCQYQVHTDGCNPNATAQYYSLFGAGSTI